MAIPVAFFKSGIFALHGKLPCHVPVSLQSYPMLKQKGANRERKATT
jgi:hypothetical protein